MPLINIIDDRKHPYRWRMVNAVVEPTWHDNVVAFTDFAEPDAAIANEWIGYDEKEHITVAEAIAWANEHPGEVTLYLWDWNDGIYISDPRYSGPRSKPTGGYPPNAVRRNKEAT